MVIKRDRWESTEQGPKDEVVPPSGPLSVSAGHPTLQASSPPTQKGRGPAVTKFPRTQGDEPPSGPRSLVLGQPWLYSGSTGWPGKDSQVQGITSFFFISPVKIIMNTKNFSLFDRTKTALLAEKDSDGKFLARSSNFCLWLRDFFFLAFPCDFWINVFIKFSLISQ